MVGATRLSGDRPDPSMMVVLPLATPTSSVRNRVIAFAPPAKDPSSKTVLPIARRTCFGEEVVALVVHHFQELDQWRRPMNGHHGQLAAGG